MRLSIKRILPVAAAAGLALAAFGTVGASASQATRLVSNHRSAELATEARLLAVNATGDDMLAQGFNDAAAEMADEAAAVEPAEVAEATEADEVGPAETADVAEVAVEPAAANEQQTEAQREAQAAALELQREQAGAQSVEDSHGGGASQGGGDGGHGGGTDGGSDH